MEEKNNFGIFLLKNLSYLIIIVLGIAMLFTAIIKETNLGFGECLIGLGVGQSQLDLYLKNKDKTTLVTMILWYAVALLGLITIIVN